MQENAALRALENAARESRARLLSYLAPRAGGELAAAEDALGEAFLAALRQWPLEGVPRKPEAWLLHTARRRLMDHQRRGQLHSDRREALQQALELASTVAGEDHDFPDERLALLFVCAHPAIDPAARTPLMLQTVLGLDAERIASAFLASPPAMSQRLVRAKMKIRTAAIPFAIPPPDEWPERLGFVLDAVYAAFTTDRAQGPGALAADDLSEQAIGLAELLVRLLPEEPEALGLLALLLYCQSRRPARIDVGGRYVALPEQDPELWDRGLVARAESALMLASRQQRAGRFQLEAAIQSVHAQRARGGETDWRAIALLYGALLLHTEALGARIGHALAVAMSASPAAGLAELDRLPVDLMRDHQPYWATRAHLLSAVGQTAGAREAYLRAIGLTEDAAVRGFLTERMHRVPTGP